MGKEKEELLRQLMGDDEYSRFFAIRNWNWAGPVTLDDLLDIGISEKEPWPPESDGVYLVSEKRWDRAPWLHECIPLYIGSTTGKSPRFRTRIGDLIADTFGFFGGTTGHSSGGISLYTYCKERQLSPRNLYIGWVDNCACLRCAEDFAIFWLEPSLNKNNPPRCKEHHGNERWLAAFKRRR